MIIVTAAEAGERIDKVLAARFEQSRTYFQFLIEEHAVLLNGLPVKKREPLKEGDEIEVEFILTPEISVLPEPIPLEIIYEDEDLLVINKQAGLVVHPAPGNWSGTFVNALLHHCREIEKDGSLRPGIVHRLDKDTTGVLVAAKQLRAHQKLIEQFSSRQVYKEYLAICVGNPGAQTIDQPIGRHPVDRKKMAVIAGGRPAVTHCTVIERKGELSLVRVVLETGRTHQIRVHMKHIQAPILGDPVYGVKREGIERQMLHAAKLRLRHPVSGQEMEFEAPTPPDMVF